MRRRRAVVAGVAGGLVGGIIGAGVMSAGHTLVTRVAGKRSEPAVTREGPPAPREEDATVKVGERLSRAVRGHPLAESEKPAAAEIVHYGFGAAMGLVYAAAAAALPAVTVGAGAGFGAAVWLGAHAVVVPALGLARSPLRQPLGTEALELVLHLAYGLTVERVRRGAIRLRTSR